MLAVALMSLIAMGVAYLAIDGLSSDADGTDRGIDSDGATDADTSEDALDLFAYEVNQKTSAGAALPEPSPLQDSTPDIFLLGAGEHTIALDIDAEIDGIVHLIDLTGFETADPAAGTARQTPEYASFLTKAARTDATVAVIGSESADVPLRWGGDGWHLAEDAEILAIILRETGSHAGPLPTEVVVNHPVVLHDHQSLTGSPGPV